MASFTQYTEVWRRLSMRQRITVGGAAAATLALVIALVFYGSQPDYGVLFSDLKPGDAQGIIEKLKAANVPYKISNGGTAVSVPADRIAELRLQMAASGVLSGGHVGFDIFDRNNFGATDFAQQVNYQRALEGELARTLEGMDEVENARVHITRSQESVFADKVESAKASVVIRMRQNRDLSRERTEAIISLVASAVEGLTPSDVSVMDGRGRLLSAAGRDGAYGTGGASVFNSQLEARRRFESETAVRVVSLLEPITGPGHVRADVAADLDFSQVEQTEEKYNPQSQVVRSKQTSEESRTSGANGIGGVTGARANDPVTQTPPVATALPRGDQRAVASTNYEIDKTVTHTVGGSGRIKRLSVSVVVDSKMENGVATTRQPAELQKMQELVAAAVGVDTARGDQIVVQNIPFGQPMLESAQLSWQERNRSIVQPAIKYGLLALAALLLIIFVVRPARRTLQLTASKVSSQLLPTSANANAAGEIKGVISGELPPADQRIGEQSEQEMAMPRTVAELEAEMEAELAREKSATTPEVTRATVITKQLTELGQNEPDKVAATLRSWLQES